MSDDPFLLHEIADKVLMADWPPTYAQALLAASSEIVKLRQLLAQEEHLANHLAAVIDNIGSHRAVWPRECVLNGTADQLDRAMQHFYQARPHRRNPYDTGEIPVVERPRTEFGWGYQDRT
jgi:hypothetical protein